MTTQHCARCLQFTSPLRPHDCPCDAFRRRQARHHAATALVLLAAALGLLYVGTLPETRLPAASQLPRATETAAGAVAATGSRLADPAASAAVVDSAGALPTEADEPAETVGVPLPSMPASSPPDTATGASANPPLTSEDLALVLAGGTTRQGVIAYAEPSFGPRYLATPEPRGTWIVICGVRDCTEPVQTNDVGPELWLQRRGRIADVSSVVFEAICGELRFGLCPGSYEVVERPVIRLPETDR